MINEGVEAFLLKIKKALSTPLPGADAQMPLGIIPREQYHKAPSRAKQAAVCAVLYPHENKTLRLAFIQRTHHKNDKHSGQISFPGGQVEPSDQNLEQTAIRELEEETGIQISDHHILGRLTSLYIPVSNFQVHPFVIGLQDKPMVMKQDDEVDEIFGYDVEKLLQASILNKDISGYGFTVKQAPYFDLDGKTLWGATAMMTNELLTVIRGI